MEIAHVAEIVEQDDELEGMMRTLEGEEFKKTISLAIREVKRKREISGLPL